MIYRKGLVSIATFSFVLILMIFVLGFSYYVYDLNRSFFMEKDIEKDMFKSMLDFRTQVVFMHSCNNSSVTYRNSQLMEGFLFNVTDSKFTAVYSDADIRIEKNITMYGMKFCDNFVFNPIVDQIVIYNGTCISII